ncbi:MAG: DUF4249 domain-containing protein [Rikenellaceae bacterium]|nr:DUF4249 domain-containing protein [Rikenellaceae bacterium]
MMRFAAILFCLSGLCSCITEYEHPGVKSISGLLVVESTITNDTTFVRLSRSVELPESVHTAPAVDNAVVTVITGNGNTYRTEAPPTQGEYYILTGALNPDDTYGLRIELDGQVYLSELLEPLFTPEIEAIDLYKRGPGEPVQLRVTTQNREESSRFYQ